MYVLARLIAYAFLLGVAVSVVESALRFLKLSDIVAKIPVVGTHLGLVVAFGLMAVKRDSIVQEWGVTMGDDWLSVLVNAGLIYAMLPVKDAIVNMINKGFRA